MPLDITPDDVFRFAPPDDGFGFGFKPKLKSLTERAGRAFYSAAALTRERDHALFSALFWLSLAIKEAEQSPDDRQSIDNAAILRGRTTASRLTDLVSGQGSLNGERRAEYTAAAKALIARGFGDDDEEKAVAFIHATPDGISGVAALYVGREGAPKVGRPRSAPKTAAPAHAQSAAATTAQAERATPRSESIAVIETREAEAEAEAASAEAPPQALVDVWQRRAEAAEAERDALRAELDNARRRMSAIIEECVTAQQQANESQRTILRLEAELRKVKKQRPRGI